MRTLFKRTIFTAAVLYTTAATAQKIDTNLQAAQHFFAEAKKAADGQQLWDTQLYGPTMFVDPDSRQTWANMPDNVGVLKPNGGIYTGQLPANVMLANTAIDWGGRKWSVMLWPLPGDKEYQLNLIIHESFHRVQEQLGLPANSPTIDHLDKKDGRIWFFLELEALKRALTGNQQQRKVDLTTALLFRNKRALLYPATFKNEQALEMNEGLAEYTGVMLGRSKDSIVHHLQTVVNEASAKTSLIRSMAYITGPLYGYLLHEASPTWTRSLKATDDFPSLIERYYGISLNNIDVNKMAAKLAPKYNGAEIIAAEEKKDAAHQQQEKQYIDKFTVQSILQIPLEKMQVSFNPNNLFDLGKYGTVYPTMSVTDTWGTLEVTDGGALMKDWKVISVSLGDKSPLNTQVIEGKGWKLTLAEGHSVRPINDGLNKKQTVYQVVKANHPFQ